jgi:hypothetical protein
MYYNLSKVLSYNAFLNFLIGERGVGKTYSVTKFCINQFKKKGYQFAYIRRYKTELKKAVPKFFDSMIKNKEFPNDTLYNKGDTFYCNDKICGYSMTLTTAQNLKGDNFPDVKYIIFDEFIIENGQHHYLQDEVTNFLGLLETIARTRDVNVFMLGNAVSLVNPYFLFFDISIPYNSDIKTYKDGLILVQMMKNEEYRQFKKQTKFGQLVAGTSYEDYAINNKFFNDNKDFIEKKTGNARCTFSFRYKENIYGVWLDFSIGKVYVSNNYNPNGILFACTKEDMTPNTMMLSIAKTYNSWKIFIKNYKLGNVYYESLKIKLAVQDILKYIIS